MSLQLVGLGAQPHPALLLQRPHEVQVLGLLLSLGGRQARPAKLLVVVEQVAARLLPHDDRAFWKLDKKTSDQDTNHKETARSKKMDSIYKPD